jgi:uncharacterized protein DUF5666
MPDFNFAPVEAVEAVEPIADADRRRRAVRIGLTGAAVAALLAVGFLAVAATASPAGIFAADPSASPSTQNGSTAPAGDHRGGGPGHGFGQITITAIDGSNLSLATADGWTRTITVDSGTTYSKAGATIALSDLKVGDEIRFRETLETSGSYTIDSIDVELPHLAGTVTAVSGSTITLRLADGSTGTLHVDSSTTYHVNGNDGAALSDVKVGMVLGAEGVKASDGSITAAQIRAGDPGSFLGRGHGGHGFGPGAPDDDTTPNATTAPSSNG